MPSLSEFAKRIRKRGKHVEKAAQEGTIKVAGRILQTVVLRTPVDTGRARGNWFTSINSPIIWSNPSARGTGSIGRGKAKMRAYKNGQKIYISNNLPYIGRLNEGWSSQAPAGFVQAAVSAGLRGAGRDFDLVEG